MDLNGISQWVSAQIPSLCFGIVLRTVSVDLSGLDQNGISGVHCNLMNTYTMLNQ